MANSTELKAKAYDVLARIEQLQDALRRINVSITEAVQAETPQDNIEQISKDQKAKDPKQEKPV